MEDTAFAMIPHKDKRYFGGEDAFAIDTMAQYVLLVVADGIGGWKSKYGYSAGKFTHSLVAEISDLFLSGIQDPESRILYPGSWIQDRGSRILDPGSSIQDPGRRGNVIGGMGA